MAWPLEAHADATAVLGDVVTNFEMDVCLPP
jgi:hypothetical protein